jgi:predicted integral membrane protein DUF2269
MHIALAEFVLFLHILVAIATFAVAVLLLLAMMRMRSAADSATLRTWAKVAAPLEPVFPVLVLLLIGLGGWLIHLSGGEFRWSDGWVMTSVITLVLMEAYGGVVLAPNGKKLHEFADRAPDGSIPADLRAQAMNRAVWAGAWGNMGAALGILFTMPTKPVGGWSVTIVVVAAVIGVLIGLRLAGSSAASAAPTSATEVASQPRP